MTDSLDARAKRVFDLLIEHSAADRLARLDDACAGDAVLRSRVHALLAAADTNDAFLKDPTLILVPPHGERAGDASAGARIGPYTLIERIGEGGFGVVYRAEQTMPVRRQVALKIIKEGMDTRQVIARFEAERQALAIMDHPNIARVFEAGATVQGRPYFVMELVRGDPVTRFCDRRSLTVTQRLELFRDICGAVQHAHQKGIIHRDIKPSNILVTEGDGEPVAKVIDFGIARAITGRLTEESITELHQIIGTPVYMSPEQADGSAVDIDTRSDIYSMGVVLYELLVGTTPLERERMRSTPPAEVQRLIREEEPLRPSHRLATLAQKSGDARLQTPEGRAPFAPGSSAMDIARCRQSEPRSLTRALRGDLDAIVMKCLEKDRQRRYPTASALADDIGRYLAQQPVLATPPSAGYRLRKFVRRRRASVLTAAAVALALLIGLAGFIVQARRAEDEAQQTSEINEFMREVLTSSEPHNAGADVRLVDVLSKASDSAAQRFAGHPLQEAKVHDLLSEVYNHLSMSQQCRDESRKAMVLWWEHAGPDDPRTLASAGSLLNVLLILHEVPQAEELLADLMPRLERVVGPDDSLTLSARRNAAVIQMLRGHEEEAERLFLELRAHPALASDDGAQILILNNLIQLYRRRLFVFDGKLVPEVIDRLEPLAREWVERSRRKLGDDSPVTMYAQVWLARLQNYRGRHQEAVDSIRAIMDRMGRRLGECGQSRIEAMYTLCEALAALGEGDEPADLQLQIIECDRHTANAQGPVMLSALSQSLEFLDRGKRGVEGEKLARELAEGMRQYGGVHDTTLFVAETYVADFVSMQGRLEEADGLFNTLMASAGEQGINHPRLHVLYGAHLTRCGRYPEAEQELQKAVEQCEDLHRGSGGSYADDIILAFINLYEAWGKSDKLAEWRALRDNGQGGQ